MNDDLLLKLWPGMSPHFLSQNVAKKEPTKKMPSTVVNAIICSAKLVLVGSHHLRAQLALWTHGTVLMAFSKCNNSVGSLMHVSVKSEYFLLRMVPTAIWKP